jgi:VanZ family protein
LNKLLPENPSLAPGGSSPWNYWLPVVLWAACIALFSSSWFSSAETWGYFMRLAAALVPTLSLPELHRLHDLIRKLAHFGVYFLLSLLLFRAFRRGQPGWQGRWSLAAVIVAVLYAGADELHQAFTPVRTGTFADVGIDTLGALAAQVIVLLVIRRMQVRSKE